MYILRILLLSSFARRVSAYTWACSLENSPLIEVPIPTDNMLWSKCGTIYQLTNKEKRLIMGYATTTTAPLFNNKEGYISYLVTNYGQSLTTLGMQPCPPRLAKQMV